MAEASYISCSSIAEAITDSSSGRELQENGFGEDVKLAVEENCSLTVPMFFDEEYIDQAGNKPV